jgi:hypothetical protein
MPLALLKQGPDKGKVVGLLILEAVVIFAGISASFWMEEWRQQREDLDTYTHLLEEIYFNSVVDQGSVPIGIAANNLALRDALHLTVLESDASLQRNLYGRLDHIFSFGGWTTVTTAGYGRLSNTPLSIPFDETMVTLDNAHEVLSSFELVLISLDRQIGELRAEHWRSAGMVSCTGAAANDGSTILMDRVYMSEIRTLLYPDGECISQAENEARARELMDRSDFRNAVRQVIDLRQDVAWNLGAQQQVLSTIQAAIEARLPDVGLPIASMELITWPQVTTAETERQTPMQQTGPHTWEASAELTEGFIKFRANEDWSINWGAPFPDIIDAPGFLWNSDRVRVEDVFPSGTAHFSGMNLPVRAGTYRVTFNSRTREYLFKALGAS